jgi:hypothetical protein
MVLDEWQRIEKIVRWTGHSVNSFALQIGLSRGENLYQIKKGNHGISKELAETISAKYPEISRGWLLTGEGDMFIADSGLRTAIPCYESDAIWLAGLDKLPQPAYVISLPRLGNASFAAVFAGKAMEPDIPGGATVILKETGVENIIPGHPYLIVTGSITALRTVKKEPSSDKLKLVAANPSFDDIIIDVCEVKKLWAVKGHMVISYQ